MHSVQYMSACTHTRAQGAVITDDWV